ncbi:MAG: hypothetical protein ACK5IC_03045 [Moheibacter sp.]
MIKFSLSILTAILTVGFSFSQIQNDSIQNLEYENIKKTTIETNVTVESSVNGTKTTTKTEVVKSINQELSPITKAGLYPLSNYNEQLSNDIILEGDWRIETDFPNAMIKIIGGEILNKSDRDLKNITLKVFLTKDNITETKVNTEGLVIAFADLSDLTANSKMKDLNIHTDLVSISQSGDYYMVLALSEKDENNKDIVRARKIFSKIVTL